MLLEMAGLYKKKCNRFDFAYKFSQKVSKILVCHFFCKLKSIKRSKLKKYEKF